jgi:hypothetical protein
VDLFVGVRLGLLMLLASVIVFSYSTVRKSNQ